MKIFLRSLSWTQLLVLNQAVSSRVRNIFYLFCLFILTTLSNQDIGYIGNCLAEGSLNISFKVYLVFLLFALLHSDIFTKNQNIIGFLNTLPLPRFYAPLLRCLIFFTVSIPMIAWIGFFISCSKAPLLKSLSAFCMYTLIDFAASLTAILILYLGNKHCLPVLEASRGLSFQFLPTPSSSIILRLQIVLAVLKGKICLDYILLATLGYLIFYNSPYTKSSLGSIHAVGMYWGLAYFSRLVTRMHDIDDQYKHYFSMLPTSRFQVFYSDLVAFMILAIPVFMLGYFMVAMDIYAVLVALIVFMLCLSLRILKFTHAWLLGALLPALLLFLWGR